MRALDSLPLIGLTAEQTISDRPGFSVLATYVQAVTAAGASLVLIPCGLDRAALHAALGRIDGLVLTGGGDVDPSVYGQAPSAGLQRVDPQRDQAEIALAHWAVDEQLPLLGICRGLQVLNVALGGTLMQDINRELPGSLSHAAASEGGQVFHEVSLVQGSALAGLIGRFEFEVNSSHHQAIRRLAPALQAVAHAPDHVVEAVELPDHPFAFGVQWHPERSAASPESGRLFQALTRAACEGYADHHG